MSFTLSWLISPTPEKHFVDETLATTSLCINRNDRMFYSNLLSEFALEFILQLSSRTPGALEIIAEGDRTIRPQTHAHALQAFRDGKSLRVDGIHRFSEPIMTLCRSLELEIGSHVNANLYLTPGAGTKALSRHFDTHDVFVLQIQGNKVWRLYDPASENPLEYLPLQRLESLRAMKAYRLKNDQAGSKNCVLNKEFTLNTGDLLYLPRGFWHEAESELDQVSCHLTLGIQPTTYLELITLALSQAVKTLPALRASLPHGYTVKESAIQQAEQQVTQILSNLPTAINARAALGELTSIFARSQGIGIENGIFHPLNIRLSDSIALDTVLRLRKGVTFGVALGTESSRLVFGSKVMAIAPAFEPACRFLASAGTFTPAQLPGSLTSDEKLLIAKQLVSEGLLTTNSMKSHVSPSVKWVPYSLDFKQRTVDWIDLGNQPLNEPFLHQTVNRLRTGASRPSTRSTRLRELRVCGEEMKPSGFIFHMSRCGSTLLSNILKQSIACTVVAEPQPINALLEAMDSTGRSGRVRDVEALLKGVVCAYGHRRTGRETRFVLKFSSWHILQIETIRRCWPDVPIIIMLRQPVEVAVSCLDQKPRWMKWRQQLPRIASEKLGLTQEDIDSLTDAAFCARILGSFLNEAKIQSRLGCTILDHRNLNASKASEVATLFGIEFRAEEQIHIQECFSHYSKDPDQRLEYVDDSLEKRKKAGQELENALHKWAQPQYEELTGYETGLKSFVEEFSAPSLSHQTPESSAL